ncbi:hypothetical protein MMC21_007669 [Puttea exsequens]|nr:hypothetical protein [Puttea exsequens]
MFTFHDYIALSYVWGDHRGLQLTRATRSQLFQKGALQKAWDALPAVIQDAIELVRELDHFHQQEPYDAKKSKEPEGRRLFLWVDQLCIVQDDEFGKALQIEQMGHIYSNAVATIMALEGEHSDMVLIRAKPDGKPRNIFPDSPTLPTNIGPLAQEEQVVRNVQGLRLVAALPAITSSVESCKWSTRAWTMQEKELSHRAIMFTNHQVYFQCREEIFQEDIVAERSFTAHDTSQSTKSSWSVPPELIRAQQPSDSAQWPQTWHMYCDIVASYMLREMTFATDILAAFRGVASVMHCIADWDQPNGIPIDILDYALLWRPIGAIRRRFPCSLDTQTTASEKTLQLPSYAWAAWVGPIDYEANTALTSLVPRFERVLNNGKTTKLVHIPRYDQKKEWQQTLEPGEDETPADASNLQNFGKLFTTGPPQVRSLAFRMHLINKPSSMWDQDGPFVLQFRAKCLRLRLGGKAKDNTHLRTPKVLLLDNDNARVGFVWHVPLLDADRSIDRHVDVVLLSKFDKIDASERDFIHELSDPPLIELEPCGFINVMLVMRMPGSDMVERLTIGKIRETYAKSAREETIRLT